MNNFFVVLTSQYFDASDIMQSIFSMKISHEIPLMCSTDSFEDEKKIERILCALLETISLEQILSRSLFRGGGVKKFHFDSNINGFSCLSSAIVAFHLNFCEKSKSSVK